MEDINHGFNKDYFSFILEDQKKCLIFNNIITLAFFILVMVNVFFIHLHPKSIWYYFGAGYCIANMVDMIIEKSAVKKKIAHAKKMIIYFDRGLNERHKNRNND